MPIITINTNHKIQFIKDNEISAPFRVLQSKAYFEFQVLMTFLVRHQKILAKAVNQICDREHRFGGHKTVHRINVLRVETNLKTY